VIVIQVPLSCGFQALPAPYDGYGFLNLPIHDKKNLFIVSQGSNTQPQITKPCTTNQPIHVL